MTVTPDRLPAIDSAGPTIESTTVFAPYEISPDVDVIPVYLPVPGMGVLPAHSFVIHAQEPVLVDTGPGGAGPEYHRALSEVIDPADIRWLWLTHTDPDHVGALAWILEAAPEAQVVTTFLAVAKLSMHLPVPLERCHFANPGETVHVGDRNLLAVAPPSFDAPETTALYDGRTRTLFSADAFGAVASAPAAFAGDVDGAELTEGMILWSTIDSPWLHSVDRDRYRASLASIDRLQPEVVLSSHLPPAVGMADALLRIVDRVPDADPWVGPDQAALEAILAQTAS
jgi:glyoxylase-like metal-dependent hydrolase (beta-lactamase superfamily II)